MSAEPNEEIILRFWDDFEEQWVTLPSPVLKLQLVVGGHTFELRQVEERLGKFTMQNITTKNTEVSVHCQGVYISFSGKVRVY